ncbi:MAG: hypothetical protein AAF808_22140 [Cyanobacteria bacterium P01_D01_bin.2]
MAEGGEGGDDSAGEQANADFEDVFSGPELLSVLQEGAMLSITVEPGKLPIWPVAVRKTRS